MKNLAFKFYSVLKNEDAMPYIGGDLLVAADGLGGSGSAIHHIDRSKHPDMHSEIMSGIFADILHASPELLQYIEELIAPLLDERDDTSALWASRIVMARCVFALTEGPFREARLDDKEVRADLAEFISKGLHSAVETFDLINGKYDNQRLLPTTLAFIRFAEQKNSVIAETVWAGDSRCYVLTAEGLKLLSVDDEDGSGSITNLFYADNPKIHLNYLRHEIQKPCILLAVSDGIFDPFDPHDHLGVEYTLLSAISESNSEQELADKLHGFFDGVHGDDATMAFVALGFSDFADMKKALKARTDKISSIRRKQEEMYSALEVMNLSEEDARHYVTSRTSDRYDYIISAVVDAIERGIDDVAITAEIRGIVEGNQKANRAAAEKAKMERREQALTELSNYVLSHPENLMPNTATTILSPLSETLKERLFTKQKQATTKLLQQKSKMDELKSKGESLAKDKEELHQMILKKIDTYRKSIDELWYDQDYQSLGQRKEAVRILNGWYIIDNALKAGRFLHEKEIGYILPSEERELAFAVKEHLDEFRDWRIKQGTQKRIWDMLESDYVQSWDKLLIRLRNDERLIYSLFSQEAIVKFGLTESDDVLESAIAESDRDNLLKEFKDRKVAIVSGIVEALAIGYNKTSVIDVQYNATKLEQFRTYYRLQRNPNNGIKEFEKELLALEARYTSLVDHAKF